MQPNQANQENTKVNLPKESSNPKADNSALWALVSGIAVFAYHIGIWIFQPNEVTIFWYFAILPIILGITGIKSVERKSLAIAGIVLAALSIVVALILFTTVYDLK
jgi:hypothetical protein